MRRPFAKQVSPDSSQPLVLPTPTLRGSTKPVKDAVEPKPRNDLQPISREKLDKAKRFLEDVGIDPAILDKLLNRVNAIDEEIEDLTAELEITRRRINELEEEKRHIYKVLSNFLE